MTLAWGILGAWLMMYGLNPLVRSWLLRQARLRREVVVTLERRLPQERIHWFAHVGIPAVILALQACNVYQSAKKSGWEQTGLVLADGPALALWASFFVVLLLSMLWPLYLRTRARSTEVALLDEQGVTVMLPRRGLSWQGAFEARVEWKDVFGYSFFKGYVLLALRPVGHIDIAYGQQRLIWAHWLHKLGLHKLNAYDMLDQQEMDERELELLEQHVEAMALDVRAGYERECAELGVWIEVERRYGSGEGDSFAYLHLGLLVDGECVHDLDWLIWAKYGEMLEVLHLPEDRLYESLLERVHSLLDLRMRELGKEKTPPRLQ
jgi:hypothetical protein